MGTNPDVKFIHYRRVVDGRVQARGGVTVAYVPEGDGFRVAVAKCHEKDNFVRKSGRIKSAGRLNSGKQSELLKVANEKEVVQVMDEGAANNGFVRSFSKRKRKVSSVSSTETI